MATSTTGILTAEATPAVARRTWPQWLALALAMLAVAVVAVVLPDAGARLLLGAVGAFLAVRGAVLVPTTRGLGAGCVVAGLTASAVAATSAVAAGWVLLVVVPLLLLGTGLGLLARTGIARRGGQALLVWSVLVAGLLVAAGVGQGWARAGSVATVVAAVAVAALAVPLLVGAAHLRAVGARPDPEPTRSLGCAGCACAGGGCGSAG